MVEMIIAKFYYEGFLLYGIIMLLTYIVLYFLFVYNTKQIVKYIIILLLTVIHAFFLWGLLTEGINDGVKGKKVWLWRYSIDFSLLYDRFYKVKIVENLSSYKSEFPYLYVYSLDGVIKISILPFYDKIEIYLYNFFNKEENLEAKCKMIDIKELREIYGDKVIIHEKLSDFSEKDLAIFKELKKSLKQ